MPKTSEDVLGKSLGLVFWMFVGTSVSILLATVDWGMWGIWFAFFKTFHAWPWIRVSLLATIVTYLMAVSSGRKQTENDQFLVYGFLYFPLILVLVYPSQQWVLTETRFWVLYFLTGAIHEAGYHLISERARLLMLARLADEQR